MSHASPSRFERIIILGAGSWGTALAIWLARRGIEVGLWGHDTEHVGRLRAEGGNEKYLPGVPLPAGIDLIDNLEAARGADLVVFVTPSRALAKVARQLEPVPLAPGVIALSCTKGIEIGTGRRMSEVLADALPAARRAVLSGPSHAEEVARHGPTAIVIGAEDEDARTALQTLFSAGTLRAYTSDDVAGIELGGALKNVYALAAGICDGLSLGDNAKAALLTRSLAEMVRLGTRLGGRRETFYGLGGVGDLMATCFSRHSRNRQVGERLGRGEVLAAIFDSMSMVAEGVPTAQSAFDLARKIGVETPIIDQVYAVLYQARSPEAALGELFQREPRAERD